MVGLACQTGGPGGLCNDADGRTRGRSTNEGQGACSGYRAAGGPDSGHSSVVVAAALTAQRKLRDPKSGGRDVTV